MATTCPHCNAPCDEGSARCLHCGVQLHCPNCGRPIDLSPIVSPVGTFCSGCGAPYQRLPVSGKPWYISAFKIVAQIVLGMLAFVFALGGACILLIGSSDLGSSGSLLPYGHCRRLHFRHRETG